MTAAAFTFRPTRTTTTSRARTVAIALPAVAFAAAAAFAALAIAAMNNNRMVWDPWLMEHIQRIDVPGLERLMHEVDWLASAPIAVPLWFALFGLFIAARWWLPAAAFMAMPIGSAINQVMSDVIARPRPEATDVIRVVGETDAFSFPSGHVAGAVLMYGLIFIIADRLSFRPGRLAVKATALVVIGTIGLARVYYGAHWPSDVFAAYALAGAVVAATAFAYRFMERSGAALFADTRAGVLGRRVADRIDSAAAAVDPRPLFRSVTAMPAKVSALSANGAQAADRFVREGIDRWEADGHITTDEAADLREQADAPEVTSALAHLGAHIAMSIPLRFPLGSIGRPLWTLSMRAKVEWNALRGRDGAHTGRQEHTLLVAAVSALPGFGAAAYMVSKPLRSRRAIAMIAFDRSMRRIPFRVYQRLRVAPLMVWHANVSRADTTNGASSATRLRALRAAALPLAGLAAVGAVAMTAFAVTGSDTVARTAIVAQLSLAGVAAFAGWSIYWQRPEHGSAQESAGIMLWPIVGLALVFAAIDPIFRLHMRLEEGTATLLSMMPMAGAMDDAIIASFVITALGVLIVFKDELLAPRASSMTAAAAVALTGVAIATDALGAGALLPLEFPMQIAAASLYLAATTLRLHEVRRAAAATDAGKADALPLAA